MGEGERRTFNRLVDMSPNGIVSDHSSTTDPRENQFAFKKKCARLRRMFVIIFIYPLFAVVSCCFQQLFAPFGEGLAWCFCHRDSAFSLSCPSLVGASLVGVAKIRVYQEQGFVPTMIWDFSPTSELFLECPCPRRGFVIFNPSRGFVNSLFFCACPGTDKSKAESLDTPPGV